MMRYAYSMACFLAAGRVIDMDRLSFGPDWLTALSLISLCGFVFLIGLGFSTLFRGVMR